METTPLYPEPSTTVWDLSVDLDVSAEGRPLDVAEAVADLVATVPAPSRVWAVITPASGYVAAQILALPPVAAGTVADLAAAVLALPGTCRGEMTETQTMTLAESVDAAFDPDHHDLDDTLVRHTAAGGLPGRGWWWPGLGDRLPEVAPAAASRAVAARLEVTGPAAAGIVEPAGHRTVAAGRRGAGPALAVWTPYLAAAAGVDDRTGPGDLHAAAEAIPLTDLAAARGRLVAAVAVMTDLWARYDGEGRRPFGPGTDPAIATRRLVDMGRRIDDRSDAALLHWLLAARVTP